MSIATEIARLQTAKEDIKTAIETRGVPVPSGDLLDSYADFILEIPDRYEILEYIQSDGTFYIPTDILLTSSMWWDYKFQLTTAPGGQNQHIFSGVSYRTAQIGSSGSFYVRRGDKNGGSSNAVLINSGHTFAIGEDRTVVCFKDGDTIYTDGTANRTLAAVDLPTDTISAWFFSVNHSSDANTFGARGKLYYMKVGTGNNLLYNFIPAKRNSDNNVGLLEIVNNRFYPSVSVS